MKRPLVELKELFEDERLRALPVVRVDQFQLCAKFKLSIVLVAVAAVIDDRAGVVDTTAQLVVVPLVVKNRPEFPV